MLYLYDEAIAEDLKRSFDDTTISPIVKVVDPDSAVPIYAQLSEDVIRYPIVAVVRSADYQIDTSRTNFTRMHRGVANVFDNETNLIYKEKAIPITLNYTISVLGDNTADIDELTRELLFKYNDMYFLTIKLPYESDRKIRFGVEVDRNNTVDRSSGFVENLSEGKLYATNIPVTIIGAVLVSYTPAKLRNVDMSSVEAYSKDQMELLK